MVLAMPWVGRYKYRKLKRALDAGIPGARIHFYRISLLQQALLTAFILWFALLGPAQRGEFGLTAPIARDQTYTMLVTFAAAIGVSILIFRRVGDRWLRRLLKMAGALLPSTARERWWFAGLSCGAGISEELFFRGFLLWYLSAYAAPKLSFVGLVVVSSAVFGFCHIYQGWTGVVGTGVLGGVLGWLYVSTGSLLLPIVIHALLDLRILAIFTPGRLRSLQLQNSAIQEHSSCSKQVVSFSGSLDGRESPFPHDSATKGPSSHKNNGAATSHPGLTTDD
jgi:membrane protease YdiL (CAAX protease family)